MDAELAAEELSEEDEELLPEEGADKDGLLPEEEDEDDEDEDEDEDEEEDDEELLSEEV